MTRTTRVSVAALAATLLLTGCLPSGPPTLAQVNSEFAQPIEPTWTADIPGIFGEPAIGGGIVAVYIFDEAVGMRLAVYSTETGEQLWEHVASPGGQKAAPLFAEQSSVSRTYPVPTIRPLLATRGEGEEAQEVVVYFERDLPAEFTISPDDIIHVADALTGDDLDVTVPGYDENEDYLDAVRIREDGQIAATAYSAPVPCGDGPTFCFEEPEGGRIQLDVGALEATLLPRVGTELPFGTYPEWGEDFVRTTDPGTGVGHVTDGVLDWQREAADIFENERMSPPDLVDFRPAGDLILLQGYQSILTTPELGNQLDLDYAGSRTVVALDPATGETAWSLPGGDALCYAVAGLAHDPEATVVPMCLATGGFFSYGYDDETMIDEEPIEASIVGVNVEDGSIEWEVEHLGEHSVLEVTRQLDFGFASRGDYSVAPDGEAPGLIDLTTGEWVVSPDKATFTCRAEREDVLPEFEGSTFVGGSNGIALGYPAGWYQFPCDAEMEDANWSKGGVRVADYPASDGMSVVVTESGLAGFRLG